MTTREIKFRAWDPVIKEILSVSKIDWLDSAIGIITKDGRRWTDNLDGYTLMQYTGVRDKNGKEIYEGDFMQLPKNSFSPRGVWEIKEDRGCFIGKEKEGSTDYLKSFAHEYEIIGNIYENKELI